MTALPHAPSPKRVSRRLHLALLGLMSVFFLSVNIAMLAGVRVDELFAGVAIGTIAAEITLCAVFASLAPVSLFLRVTVGLMGATVVCLAVFRMDLPGNDDSMEISAAAFLLWIVVQIPLWVFRVRSGWSLRRPTGGAAASMRGDMQFGIRQLMAWTAVVAVALSVAKIAIPDDSIQGTDDPARTAGIVGMFAVFNALAAWPVIWAAFVRSRMLAWWGVAIVCLAILCFVEVLAFEALLGPDIDVTVFVAVHLIQLVTVGGSLLLIRLGGVRLVRAVDG